MSDVGPGDATAGAPSLPLIVGCRFGLGSMIPAHAILQVAPRLEPGLTIESERWETNAEHHGYVDGYQNRCERFELASGSSQLLYEARVVIARPADLIEPAARECPSSDCPKRC